MLQTRAVIDYALARRATLADLQRGTRSRSDVCDAHPYLLRAAKYHGEPTEKRCPTCRTEHPLAHVTYVYGDELGEASGRVRARAELPALSLQHAELRVYVVEVCLACSWNHLTTSFLIGTGRTTARRSARRRTART